MSILFSHEPRRELQKKVKWKVNQIGRHLWSGLLGDLFLYAFSRLKWSILVNVILSRSSTFFHELCICTKYLWVMNGVLSSQVLLFPIKWMICKWNKDCKISSSICLAVVYGSSTIHVYFLFAVFCSSSCVRVLLYQVLFPGPYAGLLSFQFRTACTGKTWLHIEISFWETHS